MEQAAGSGITFAGFLLAFGFNLLCNTIPTALAIYVAVRIALKHARVVRVAGKDD
jgi:CBS domain containing-hemolysin-like protein